MIDFKVKNLYSWLNKKSEHESKNVASDLIDRLHSQYTGKYKCYHHARATFQPFCYFYSPAFLEPSAISAIQLIALFRKNIAVSSYSFL